MESQKWVIEKNGQMESLDNEEGPNSEIEEDDEDHPTHPGTIAILGFDPKNDDDDEIRNAKNPTAAVTKGWITLKPHGGDEDGYVHVLVDGDGKVMAGPKGMEGKNVSHLDKTHEKVGEESKTKPKVEESKREVLTKDSDVDTKEPVAANDAKLSMTHKELGQKIADVLKKYEDFAGKVVPHKDGAIRVYLRANSGGKKGWEEKGAATIEEDGSITIDKEFEHALRYSKPLLEEIRSLPQAGHQERIKPQSAERRVDRDHPDYDDPMNRMQREHNQRIVRDKLERG